MEKRDYSDIKPGIVEAYVSGLNTTMVARKFSVSPSTVCRILDEAGVERRRCHCGRKRDVKPQDDSCFFCHSVSKVSYTEGYCLKHKRGVRLSSQEHCFN